MCFYSRLVQNGKKVEIGALTSLCKSKTCFYSYPWKKRKFYIFSNGEAQGLFQNGDLSCCVLKNVLLAKL